MTHPSLARIPAGEQAREMTDSRERLERTIGMPVAALAYPFGTPEDVSTVTVRAASAVSEFAMATDAGCAWRWSPRWRLPRAAVRDWDAAVFARRLDEWFQQ